MSDALHRPLLLRDYLALRRKAEDLERKIEYLNANIARLRSDCEKDVAKLEQEKKYLGADLSGIQSMMAQMEEADKK